MAYYQGYTRGIKDNQSEQYSKILKCNSMGMTRVQYLFRGQIKDECAKLNIKNPGVNSKEQALKI